MGFFSSIGDAISGAVGAVGDFLGGAGGVVGDVASGVLGLAGNKNTNATNSAMNAAQLQLAREQFEWQKELAKNQIAWRVEDAKKARLHPMAALGLQSTSFSPVSSSFTPMQSPDYSFLSDMGQSASYAAMKAKDRKEQAAAVRLAQEQAALQTENMNLQNEGLRIDNEFRQWQLMTAMQGGANQALNSPASARLNQKELVDGQADSPISGLSFTPGTSPLMSLSRMGDTLVAHIDPNKSDAITEDFFKNLVTQLQFNKGAWNGEFGKEVAKHFTSSEVRALKNGDAVLAVIPGVGWRFVKHSKFRPKYSKNRREVSGKLYNY